MSCGDVRKALTHHDLLDNQLSQKTHVLNDGLFVRGRINESSYNVVARTVRSRN